MNSIMIHCKARLGIPLWIGLLLLAWTLNGSADSYRSAISDADFDGVRYSDVGSDASSSDRDSDDRDSDDSDSDDSDSDDRDSDDSDSDDKDSDDSDSNDLFSDDRDSDDNNGDGDPGTENITTIHISSSPHYNKNCSECHEGIHTRQTLDPLIPDAHVAMLPFAPGETDSNDTCTWCHRSVDLVQAAGSPLVMRNSNRKRIDPRLCTMCHGPSGPAKQFYQVNLSSLQLDGSELYDLICSGCHKVLADSEVKGESAAEIQKKINENEGGMGPLGVLKTEQIQTIAVALGGDPTPLPPPTDGVVLYTQNCASCHGGLASSDKQGTFVALIQSAIDSNTGDMGSLSALTPQQIQAIAAALAQ